MNSANFQKKVLAGDAYTHLSNLQQLIREKCIAIAKAGKNSAVILPSAEQNSVAQVIAELIGDTKQSINKIIDLITASTATLAEDILLDDRLRSIILASQKRKNTQSTQSRPPVIKLIINNQEKALSDNNFLQMFTDDAQSLCFINSYAQELDSICSNLISNALKYPKKNTTSAHEVIIHAEVLAAGSLLQITVADNGCGISQAAQKKLFHENVLVSENQNDHSSCLGLAQIKKLANQVGGDIKLSYSDVNRGSTFCVVLPVKQMTLDAKKQWLQSYRNPTWNILLEKLTQWRENNFNILRPEVALEKLIQLAHDLRNYASAFNGAMSEAISLLPALKHNNSFLHKLNKQSDWQFMLSEMQSVLDFLNKILPTPKSFLALTKLPDSHPAIQLHKIKILIVDDERTSLKIMVKQLSKIPGMKIFIATNGKDAWEILQAETSINLVVTDINMPMMNGYELAEQLRANKDRYIPIIGLGGDPDDAVGAAKNGFNYFICKPCNIADELAKIFPNHKIKKNQQQLNGAALATPATPQAPLVLAVKVPTRLPKLPCSPQFFLPSPPPKLSMLSLRAHSTPAAVHACGNAPAIISPNTRRLLRYPQG